MKRKLLVLLLLCLCLSGCAGVTYPEKAADGAEWNTEWFMHGNLLGIEPPEGVALEENYAVLTMQGLTTSVWGVGEPEGEEGAEYYPAQIYVLAKECAATEEAQESLAEWAARLEETWDVSDTWEAERNGQRYFVMDCASVSEELPYKRELAAMNDYGAWAVCVELDCRDTFSGDAESVLYAFLDGCHYNAALQN